MVFKKTYKNETLQDLAIASQKGDKSRYRVFLERANTLVFTYLKSRLNNEQDIQDVAQITLMALHTSLHTYDNAQNIENWIYGIAKYKWLDHLRKHYKKNDNEFVNHDAIETFFSSDTNDIVSVKHDLAKIMKILPEKQKQILTLLKIQGHSVAEVAHTMKMSENNVKVTAHRALKTLQESTKTN